MSETLDAAITELQQQVRNLDSKARQIKQTINLLCEQNGTKPLYANLAEDTEKTGDGDVGRILPDTFHGKPLAKAVRMYLAMRKKSNIGPATIEDIYDMLLEGGYDFEKEKAPAIQGLSISLGKSAHTFRHLPNGHYGLTVWYGDGRKQRRRPKNSAVSDESMSNGDEETLLANETNVNEQTL